MVITTHGLLHFKSIIMRSIKHFFFLLLILISVKAVAQQNASLVSMANHNDSLLNMLPREKIYLHTDKSSYLSSDTLWFKAYLLNGSTHIYSTKSQLIYVDLINNSSKKVEQTISLPTQMGITWGGFILNERKHNGYNYTIRAYTNWMRNFDDELFFSKEIKIINSDETINKVVKPLTSKPDNQNNSPAKNSQSNIDLQFLPEGGRFIANAQQVMAFKAVADNGLGIPVKGLIKDAQQNVVATFDSNTRGIGSFKINTKSEQQYTALITVNGAEIKYKLPKVDQEGIALQVKNNYASDSLTIILQTNIPTKNLKVIGQSRGKIYFATPNIKVNSTKTFKVAKSVLPTGVCQIIALNENDSPINQRSLFINHHDELNIETISPKTSYTNRDSIPVRIKVTNESKQGISSSLSVAVTDDNQVLKDSLNDNNILSYILLSSDLKGNIEQPAYYFTNYKEEKHRDLDNLLLTQAWVNYKWEIKNPTFKAENEYTISGHVGNFTNAPAKGVKVTLLGKNQPFMIIDTVTNASGDYAFDKLPSLSNARLLLQAKNLKDKKGSLSIEVNEFTTPPVSIKKNLYYENKIEDNLAKQMVAANNQVYKGDGTLLNEVLITAKKTVKNSKNLNGPGQADQVINEEDLKTMAKTTLLEVLYNNVKGFNDMFDNKTQMRYFAINQHRTYFIIDGVNIDLFFNSSTTSTEEYSRFAKLILDQFTADNINGIEVMAFTSKSSKYRFEYLMESIDNRPLNFIEITTKSGQGPYIKKPLNQYLIRPVNYGFNKYFYSPKYTAVSKNDMELKDFRSTIYWNPNIVTNDSGEADFHFYSSDSKGTYTVIIEGTDMNGSFGYKLFKLTIE